MISLTKHVLAGGAWTYTGWGSTVGTGWRQLWTVGQRWGSVTPHSAKPRCGHQAVKHVQTASPPTILPHQMQKQQ